MSLDGASHLDRLAVFMTAILARRCEPCEHVAIGVLERVNDPPVRPSKRICHLELNSLHELAAKADLFADLADILRDGFPCGLKSLLTLDAFLLCLMIKLCLLDLVSVLGFVLGTLCGTPLGQLGRILVCVNLFIS